MGRTRKGKRKAKFFFVFIAIILGIALLVALLQYLWNMLMPAIFGLITISYWQAFGLFVLSRILFGRGFPKPRNGFRPRKDPDAYVSEEDREKLKSEWRKRFDDRWSC